MSQRLPRTYWRQAILAAVKTLHYAILIWGLVGWLAPANDWLIAYLIVTPLLAVQWLLNRGVCVLNNLESWIAGGRWRDDSDPNQGGFLAGLIERASGVRPTARTVNHVSYSLLALFWTFAAIHLACRMG